MADSQHRPTVTLQVDVFPSEPVSPRTVAELAWDTIAGWVERGYMPVLIVEMPGEEGPGHLVDLEERE